jgi:hypothetical protein
LQSPAAPQCSFLLTLPIGFADRAGYVGAFLEPFTIRSKSRLRAAGDCKSPLRVSVAEYRWRTEAPEATSNRMLDG